MRSMIFMDIKRNCRMYIMQKVTERLVCMENSLLERNKKVYV
jgi:hypothetical protein